MNLSKKLWLYLGLPVLAAFLIFIGWGWYQAGKQQEMWNTIHTSLTEQLRDQQKKLVLTNALYDYILYSEFRADLSNPQAAEEHSKAKALLERLEAGERDSLIEPTVQGLHLVKTWFPDHRQTADQVVAQFQKDYKQAGQVTVPLMVMKKAFDDKWANR